MKKYILPKGFSSAGIHSGIKKRKKDTGLIYSEKPCNAAAMFTSNNLKSAHIISDKKKINGKISAIFTNSGNANVFTGRQGIKDIEKITAQAGKLLGLKGKAVLSASTGIIGKLLPVKKILKSLPVLVSGLSKKDENFPKSIMTTDLSQKVYVKKLKLGKKTVTITGAAKGAGMINPNMATMLAFIMTDASVTKAVLKQALKSAVEGSFNRVTVDGDTSPNDSVIILANGASGVKIGSGNYSKFKSAIYEVCLFLAEEIVKDGEGATKFIKITVKNAKSEAQAKKTAEAMANSLLFKTAAFGESVNFGRIPSNIGVTGEKINIDKVKAWLNKKMIISNGKILKAKGVKNEVKKKEIEYTISLGTGNKEYFVLTTDLSYQYVKINAEYS